LYTHPWFSRNDDDMVNRQLVPAGFHQQQAQRNYGRLAQWANDQLTHKQLAQVANTAGRAAKTALSNVFRRQNAGLDSHDAKTGARRRQPTGRAPRRRNRAPLQMPESRPHHTTAFSQMSNRQAMQEAWTATPAGGNLIAPRGVGYYDAFKTFPNTALTHLSIGPCTPIVGKTVAGYGEDQLGNSGAIDTAYYKGQAQLLIVNPCYDDTQAVLYKFRPTTGSTGPPNPQVQIDASPFGAKAFKDNAPSDAIPSRCSLRLRNYTAGIARGGVVRVLRMTTGISLVEKYTTNAELMELMDGIRENRRTMSYDGPEFVEAFQKNCVVCDQSRSLWFTNWGEDIQIRNVPWARNAYSQLPSTDTGPDPPTGPPAVLEEDGTTVVQYSALDPVYPWQQALRDPSYTPIAILFEPFESAVSGSTPVGNVYEATIQSQFLAHYKQGTMLSNMAITPASNHNAVEGHRNKEEAKGSAFERVAHTAADVFSAMAPVLPMLMM